MKAEKAAFGHYSYFGIRLPARPLSQLLSAIDNLLAGTSEFATPDGLLRWLTAQSWFDESVFLASPTLQQALHQTQAQAQTLNPAQKTTLWRYIFRGYARSTPYGLFAGMGTGTIDLNSEPVIAFGPNPWHAISRPDITVLNAIVRHLSADEGIRLQLHYTLNDSLYEAAGEYRFSERIEKYDSSKIQLSSLSVTPDLSTLVNFLRTRSSVSFSKLTTLFGDEHQEAATGYIHELIDANFLVSSLAFPITGSGGTDYVLRQLSTLVPPSILYNQLRDTVDSLSAASATLPVFAQSQQQLQTLLMSLESDKPIGDSNQVLVQTDLFFKPQKLSIPEDTILTLADQFSHILPVLATRVSSPLTDFVQRFRSRFDQQTVDLLVVLDPQVGISLIKNDLSAYSLLSELPFANPGPVALPIDGLEDLRERLYNRFSLGQGQVVTLTEDDLQRVSDRRYTKPVPPCWYMHGELLRTTASQNSAGLPADGSTPVKKLIFVLNSSLGVSPVFLFGRFCHGDEALRTSVERMCIWEQDQYPDDILAEIVHLPVHPHRAGNVVSRPVLRRPELPYLTPAGVAPADQLSLSDLSVRVSHEGEVILIHRPTGKRVRPRHTSAHNPQLGDEIYQFLSLVHQQEFDTWGWSWGALGSIPVLPRIVYQNLIVTPAQWTIKRSNLPIDSPLTVGYLRSLFALPRYVLLIEGDNKLLLDLDFEPAQQILADEVTRQSQVLLKEWLAGSFQPLVHDGDQSYVSELIIPLKTLRTAPLPSSTASTIEPSNPPKIAPTKRTFLPGDEWLYIKVYLHESVADDILVNVVQPFVKQARLGGWLNDWFFIRYADPDYHLRLRFRTVDDHHNVLLMQTIRLSLHEYVESGVVARVQIDTYERELERYGFDLITECESIFSSDSDLVLSWLVQADVSSESQRYALATYSVDQLMSDFGFTIAQKTALSQRLQQDFFQEQGGSRDMKQSLNKLFRAWEDDFFDWTPSLKQIGLLRSKSTRSAVESIRTRFKDGLASAGFAPLIGSLIHMTLNRIFSGQSRRHEMVVYHFMARRYEKVLALSRKPPPAGKKTV